MSESALNEEDKKILLEIARDAIVGKAREGRTGPLPDPLPRSLAAKQGAFVTIHKRGELRGCIGTFFGEGDLAATTQKMAVAAGWEDPRFGPLDQSELDDLEIEISVLSPLAQIDDVARIEVGKHGIYITKGNNRGLLLPQVAVEHGWDRDQFLSHTCVKAGLPADAWKKGSIKIEVFSAEVFGEIERG